MKSVLSTKILTPSQQELLLNAGLGFAHYNAIKIEFLDFTLTEEDFDFYIFTSQNGVKSLLKARADFRHKDVFCVGEKTKSLLEKNDVKVVETAENSSELAEIIVKSYKNSSFLHIGGNLKIDDLSKRLKEYNVRYVEIEGYRTELNPKKFERVFDGVLFYSPSGVQSFTRENTISGTAFCIGNTTATETRKHTNRIVVSKKPTVENVIVQAVKHFNQNKKNT